MFNLLLDWEVERLRGGYKYFRDYVVLCEWDKEKDKDKDFRDDWCLCEVVPGPRQAKQVATERLFKFLLTQIPHRCFNFHFHFYCYCSPPQTTMHQDFLQSAPKTQWCTRPCCTKTTLLHQAMHQKFLRNVRLSRWADQNIPRHTQDNRDILTKEGWQHVVTGRAKVYDECLVVLKLCLSHSPTELAHALWGNLALSSKSEYQILILHFLKSGRPLPDKLVLGVLWDFAQNHSFAKQLTPFHIFTSLALKSMYGIPEPF